MKIGNIGKGNLEVKYGRNFPVVGEEMKIHNKMGRFVIRYVWIGTPKWTPKHTVLVPVSFELVEIVEVSKIGKAKISGFKILN